MTLRDASPDRHIRPTQRMIAGASLGMEVEDAYYSVRELREAVQWVQIGWIQARPVSLAIARRMASALM
ncbi:hypothetical protein [Sphingobium baderi]|uniref:hypothetical protein n=1 Tax=Sphingobium baderi TaxID=1332080 RepID=UPI002B40C242|nr:hypothetical protein [Sphingobium baderi]WRD78945.1 hypothetical protein QQ987_20495 [Sphingobium baderi]